MKSMEDKATIRKTIENCLMFQNLDEKEKKIVIDAFEEKKVAAGATVILQGDDGGEMYMVETGDLDCSKVFVPEEGEKHLKVYGAGDVFGETERRLRQEVQAGLHHLAFASGRHRCRRALQQCARHPFPAGAHRCHSHK